MVKRELLEDEELWLLKENVTGALCLLDPGLARQERALVKHHAILELVSAVLLLLRQSPPDVRR